MRKIMAIPFLFLGSIVSAIVLSLAIFTGSGTIINALVIFSTPTAGVLEWTVPSAFWYWAVPEGGGAAAVLLFGLSAWLQLAVLFAVFSYFIWVRRSNPSFKRDWLKPAP